MLRKSTDLPNRDVTDISFLIGREGSCRAGRAPVIDSTVLHTVRLFSPSAVSLLAESEKFRAKTASFWHPLCGVRFGVGGCFSARDALSSACPSRVCHPSSVPLTFPGHQRAPMCRKLDTRTGIFIFAPIRLRQPYT